jgi:Pentapeptide repeats (8 copies)
VASAEHLEILAQGRERWAAWRAANPNTVPDFRDADLSRIPLVNVDLKCANLTAAKLDNSDLEGTDLRKTDLRGADLASTVGLLPDQLAGSDLTRAKLPDALDTYFKELKAAKENLGQGSEVFHRDARRMPLRLADDRGDDGCELGDEPSLIAASDHTGEHADSELLYRRTTATCWSPFLLPLLSTEALGGVGFASRLLP